METARGYLKYDKDVPYFTNPVDKDLRGQIHLSPYSFGSLDVVGAVRNIDRGIMNKFYPQKRFIFTESGRGALLKLLRDVLHLSPNDGVAIFKSLSSLNSSYISSCVTDTIGKVCKWSYKIKKNTKVILVVHEFGYPYPLSDLEKYRGKYVLVEDVAYGFGSSSKGHWLGSWGDYALLSFSKIIPLQYGGALIGTADNAISLEIEQVDHISKALTAYLSSINKIIKKRVKNWDYLAVLFRKKNLNPLVSLIKGMNPGVFILDCSSIRNTNMIKMEKVKQCLKDFGIENTIYYPLPALILPCHQGLDKYSLDYIVGAVNFSLNKIFK